MIVEVFLEILVAIVQSVSDWGPDFEPPEWMTQASSMAGHVYGFAGSMGVWFNWGLLGIVLSTLLMAWLVGFGIKLVRIIASYLTLGGGSAA